MHCIDKVHAIQIVSYCLAPHEQCSGLYSDQHGTILVRCACKCHAARGLCNEERPKKRVGVDPTSPT